MIAPAKSIASEIKHQALRPERPQWIKVLSEQKEKNMMQHVELQSEKHPEMWDKLLIETKMLLL